MKILINLSNHSSDKWSADQRKGWDKIIDIPFPNIPANITEIELIENYITPMTKKLAEVANEIGGNEFNIMLQGEFTFCYLLRDVLKGNFEGDVWNFYVPTTERKTVEKVKEDGTVEKISTFEFVRWRIV